MLCDMDEGMEEQVRYVGLALLSKKVSSRGHDSAAVAVMQ